MIDAALREVLAQKAQRLQRAVARARKEWHASADVAHDDTHQDAALLNVQRACEQAIDMANLVCSAQGWSLPEGARAAFRELARQGWIDTTLADALARMIAFRNVLVHEYETLDLAIVQHVIDHHLDDLLRLAAAVLQRALSPNDTPPPAP
ncbi:MAG: type VII toxin-antitoxin system HepT family RNase toxin [Tepidimonas ignava]